MSCRIDLRLSCVSMFPIPMRGNDECVRRLAVRQVPNPHEG